MKNWTEQFRAPALAQIKEKEAFLVACGMLPQGGMEQEFYVATPVRHGNGAMAVDTFSSDFVHEEFRNSPFVEKVDREASSAFVYEAAVGQGNDSRTKTRPHASLLPSTIVRATETLRTRMKDGAQMYVGEKGAEVDFGGSKIGLAASGLQSNVSLWDPQTSKPLFTLQTRVEEGKPVFVNELTQACADGILAAQQALPALVTTSVHSLRRTRKMFNTDAGDAKYSVGAIYKNVGNTLMLRQTTAGEAEKLNGKQAHSFYLEDCYPGGGEEPALAMLLTLGGMEQGVKNYMKAHDIATPDAMKAHIASGALDNEVKFKFTRSKKSLPDTMTAALAETQSNPLAIEILGKKLHDDFCAAYKQQALGKANGAGRSAG